MRSEYSKLEDQEEEERWACSRRCADDLSRWRRLFLFWFLTVGCCFGAFVLGGLLFGVIATANRSLVWN
jgi:hypothetical protein